MGGGDDRQMQGHKDKRMLLMLFSRTKRKRKLFKKREDQTQWVVGMTDKCRGTEKEDVIDVIQ